MNINDPGFEAIIESLRAQDAAYAEQQSLAQQRQTESAGQLARQQDEARRLQTLAGQRVAGIAVAVARSALEHGVPFDLRVYTRVRNRPGVPPEFADGSRPIRAWFLEHFGPAGYEPFDGPRSSSPGYVLDREGSIRSIHESGNGRRPILSYLISTEGMASFEPRLARFVIDHNLQV